MFHSGSVGSQLDEGRRSETARFEVCCGRRRRCAVDTSGTPMLVEEKRLIAGQMAGGVALPMTMTKAEEECRTLARVNVSLAAHSRRHGLSISRDATRI